MEIGTEPFQATDFYWNIRLAKLFLPTAAGRSHIRLIDSRKLLKYILEGGVLKTRTQLEEENDDVFCTTEFTKKVLMDLDKRPSRKDLVFFPGIVAVSHALGDLECPESNNGLRQQLAPILEWIMSERALLMMRSKGEFKSFCQVDETDAPSACEFGIFIDFMCLQRIGGQNGNQQEMQNFQRVRYNAAILFAHALTLQLKVTESDEGAASERRGWCLLEKNLASLIKRPEYRLDISAWRHRSGRFGATATSEFGTAAGHDKTMEELAEQGDCYAAGHAQTLNAIKDTSPRPPMSHTDLAAALEGHAFSSESDMAACRDIYRAVADCLLGEKKSIELTELDLQDEDWKRLGNVLGHCPKLSTLTLRRMNLTEGKTRSLFAGVVTDSVTLSALTSLSMPHNAIAGGMEALTDAIGSGAFPVLKTLNLCNCRVDSNGFRKLVEAVAGGQLRQLTALDLSSNRIGDAGMEAVAQLSSGALPQLAKLHLYGCNIGDNGCFALVAALSSGAMPRLTQTEHKDQEGHIDIFRRRNSMSDRLISNSRRSLSLGGPGSSHSLRATSPGRQGSIGMLVGQNQGLTVDAKEALDTVLADRSKGRVLVKRHNERRAKAEEEAAAAEKQMGEVTVRNGDAALPPSCAVNGSGSACCSIS